MLGVQLVALVPCRGTQRELEDSPARFAADLGAKDGWWQGLLGAVDGLARRPLPEVALGVV